ncbi:MAG: glycosyltransferase family 4 protein [Candidatus Omnitrophica bacterium]|nr:glycosyltransferase family 4 protein [Candidatus Omnitrophota bacterium]
MIKIVYFHEGHQFGGAERSLLNLIRHLDRHKFSPYFICSSDQIFTGKLSQMDTGYDILSFPSLKRNTPLKVFADYKQLVQTMQELKPDILHSNSPRTNFYSGIIGHHLHIPAVWHARNLLSPGQKWDPDCFFAFLSRVIICNSDAIRKRFKKKAITILNGVDTNKFHPEIPVKVFRKKYNLNPNATILMMTSRICPNKGHETFLQAGKLLHETNPDIQLVIVGDAPVQEKWRIEKLKQLTEQSEITNRVIFTGFVDNVPEALSACDIFIHAADAEPCGRVLFEAMAMAKPVIATNTGGNPEIIKDNVTGILMSPRNPLILADNILHLIQHPDTAKKMGQQGRKRVLEQFSIQKHVQATQKIYEQIMDGTLCV